MSILDELPNSCGLISAMAEALLLQSGIKAQQLIIGYGENDGHAIVVFERGKELAAYDDHGSGSLIGADWDTDPKVIAQAWADLVGIENEIKSARWV